MRYVEADGLRVSVLGLGTWQFGSREWGYGEAYASEVAPALVRRALELGITMLDTAEAYGPGRSERIVGAALSGIPASDRAVVTVATKFLPIAPAEPIVAWQAAGSRRRLAMDALDLYYAHWPNPFVSARRTMQALRPLLASGVVRRVAVSNYPLERWREADRALGAPVVANQVRFNLLDPAPRRDLVPHAAAHDRLVVAYSPLAQGLLPRAADGGLPADPGAGTHEGLDPTVAPMHGFRGRSRMFRSGALRPSGPLVETVREIAAAHRATPAQVALAWVINHPNTVAIPGARTIEQLEENAAAADLVLTDDELARLSAEADAHAGRPGR
jgi:aryl-alcohol dehydrogenase-like predicted oxidoreductase